MTSHFSCWHCSQKFYDKKLAYAHLLESHFRSTPKCLTCGELQWPGTPHNCQANMESISVGQFDSDDGGPSSVKQARLEQNKFEQARLVPSEKIWMCAVCAQFGSESRLKFAQHIAGHKDVDEYQCQECGRLFANGPLMAKHLIDEHSVEQPHIYMEKYPACKPATIMAAAAAAAMMPGAICTQCNPPREFANQNALAGHMRVHGNWFNEKYLNTAARYLLPEEASANV